jgi:acyl-homoserine-lactone acylase
MLLADRVLPDLIAAASASSVETVRLAAKTLQAWDRQADSSSKGAVLFTEWWAEYGRRRVRQLYAVPWSEQSPRTTPTGLADTAIAVTALAAAVDSVSRKFGSADVAWGRVYRLKRDGLDFAGSGADAQYGVFRVIGFSKKEPDGKLSATGGTSWVSIIEFSNPLRAVSIIPYGNASRAGSPHRTDQLALFARKEFKPVWRTHAEIEKHLERREHF